MDATALSEVAAGVAREAADLARTVRDEAVTDGVDTKSTETDVVTTGDRAVERLVRERLAELRPGEPVLGEEEGGGGALEGLRWVVDPIDGTVNYLYGFPSYAVSLAAQLDGRSVAGAVVEPVSGRVWSAAVGHGAFLNGRPLRVSSSDRLDLALVGTGFSYGVDRRTAQARVVGDLLGQVRDIRRTGAASLDLCAVAAGWLDATYEVGLNRWDWAAGALIAQEAGARLRLPEKGSADGLGDEMLVCATPGIADGLLDALRAAGAGEV
ncbi:inositol monophosphatase family protein [Saccharopolyspora rhizosphaerae]|uniref:inositol monophosphatase family protein n=1 Tax=Saccharopolyspora rhizosphaerae TaxID=2492662 RepID=UPI001F1CB4E2|nr:inositol monophosphatase family protein [Saccharopolyspora rhizosphaerae]